MVPDFKQLRVLGHPAHVPLTHFPLALWTIAFLGDLVYAWSGTLFWRSFAFWNIVCGLGIGSLTLCTGFYDYLFIPENKLFAAKTATLHMMVMLGATCLFGVSLYFHRGTEPLTHFHLMMALLFSGTGTLLLHWGGWLGGQLVYRHGLGYDL